MLRLFVLLGLSVLLAACVDTTKNSPFSAEEAAVIRQQGAGVIIGHAFRTRDKGRVVNAAGEIVRLIPATAYARERYERFFGPKKFLPYWQYPFDEPDPGYAAMTRTTKSKANGRFAFANVAPGRYFVATQVVWDNGGYAIFPEGGAVYDEVTLTGKETEPVEVILSGK
jgi:hypothetical protein